MRIITCLLLAGAAALLFLGLAGCSGGGFYTIREGYESITSVDTQLESGAYADIIHFTAKKDGWICIDMISAEVDSLIIAWWGSAGDFDDETYIDMDDDGGDQELDARLVFRCYGGYTYSCKFTTFGANDFGDYYFRVHHVSSPYTMTKAANPAKPKVSISSYRTLEP